MQISYSIMCSKRDSNSHGHFCPKDFKSFVSTIPPSEQLFRLLKNCAVNTFVLKSGAKIVIRIRFCKAFRKNGEYNWRFL